MTQTLSRSPMPSFSLGSGLLAADAAIADRPTGPCSLCRRAILRGHRSALLVPSGRVAHLSCIAWQAATMPDRAA
jgi:hypothetical protein